MEQENYREEKESEENTSLHNLLLEVSFLSVCKLSKKRIQTLAWGPKLLFGKSQEDKAMLQLLSTITQSASSH